MKIPDEEKMAEWLDRGRREMFPKMKESALSMTIWNENPDPKLVLEVGAAVCFNKPILVLAVKGVPIPPMLRSLAVEIIEVDSFRAMTPADQRKIQDAIQRVSAKV